MIDVKDPKVLEVSLVDAPRNRRRFVTLKGSVTRTGIPDDATIAAAAQPVQQATPDPASPIPGAVEQIVEESAAPAETEADTPPAELIVEQADAATSDVSNEESVALVVRSAFGTTIEAVMPREVVQALHYIVNRSDVDISDVDPPMVLDEERKVHILSLLSAIPADSPEDIQSAAAVIQAWENQGFPMRAMPWDEEDDDEKEAVAAPSGPPPGSRRVLDANHLIECCNGRARQILESGGEVEQAAELLGFCKKVKKALPDGGFVIVSGVVPQNDAVPMTQLSALWKSSDSAMTGLIQSVIEEASLTSMSEADRVKAECESVMQAFSQDVLAILSNATDHPTALQQMQEAFNNIGAKLPTFVDRLHPSAVSQSGAAPAAALQEIADRLARVERSITMPRPSIPFTPAPPQPKSIRSAIEFPPPTQRGRGLTAAQLVDAATQRHVTGFPI